MYDWMMNIANNMLLDMLVVFFFFLFLKSFLQQAENTAGIFKQAFILLTEQLDFLRCV